MYPSLFVAILVVVSCSAWEIGHSKYGLGLNTRDSTFDHESYSHVSQMEHGRKSRQVHGSSYVNSDKTSGVNFRMPLGGNDRNIVSAIGGVGLDANRHLQSATAGLALDNIRGHGLSLTNTHIPNFGNRLTAAGHANVFHNPNHDVTANAFLTRNMPTIPHVPNFNTVGGSVDYMFKNKVGASLGASHTPFLQRTDYSATGNLNLFRDRSSSLDFNAGLSKSVSPFMKSSWEPSTGFTFRKFF